MKSQVHAWEDFFVVVILFLFCFFQPIGYKKPLDSQSISGTRVHTCSTGSFWDHKYFTLLFAGSLPQVAFILVALSIGATHRHIVTVTLRDKERKTNTQTKSYSCYWILHSSNILNPRNHFQNKTTSFGFQWPQVVVL